MAHQPLLHLLDRITNKPLFITEKKLAQIVPIIEGRILRGEAIPVAQQFPQDEGADDCPYTLSNGIAIIPVQGTLTKRASGMMAMSGLASYEKIMDQVADAYTDPNVKGILLDVDSPGGEAAGMFELSDFIFGLRGGGKPIWSICNDEMCSAAYAVGSAADSVWSTRTGFTGSIGAYMLHVDTSERDKQLGLKYTYIAAPAEKVLGNPHEPLPEAAYNDLMAEVTRLRDMFVQTVSRNRGVSAEDILGTKAAVMNCEQAAPMLVDKVGSLADAYAAMLQSLGITPEDDQGGDNGDEDENGDMPSMPMGALAPALVKKAVVSMAQDPPEPEPEPEPEPVPVAASSSSVVSGTLVNADFLTGLQFDVNGRFDVNMGAVIMGPIAPHKTATSDKAWDAAANEGRLKLDQSGSYYRRAYAWVDSSADETKKASYKFIHHEVDGSGNIGAANIKACQSGIGNLNGARSRPDIPSADRKGVYNHLAKHIRDAGLEPAPLKSESELPAFAETEVPGWAAAAHTMTSMAVAHRVQPMLYAMRHLVARELGVTPISAIGRFLQTRAEVSNRPGQGRRMNMLVVPYGQMSSDLGGFREIYAPGCFKDGLARDPCSLFDHNTLYFLGRSSAKTARFWEEETGVFCECDAPNTHWADDLLVSMLRGDIKAASAAFWILNHHWEIRDGERVRVIERALLLEAGPQGFPAYGATQASVQQESAEAVAAHAVEHELDEARLRLAQVS